MVKAKRKLGGEDGAAAAPTTTEVVTAASKPSSADKLKGGETKAAPKAGTAAERAGPAKQNAVVQPAELVATDNQAPSKRQKQQQKQAQPQLQDPQQAPGSLQPSAAGTSGKAANAAAVAPAPHPAAGPATPQPQQHANAAKAGRKAQQPISTAATAAAGRRAVPAAAGAIPQAFQGKGAKHTPGGVKAKVIDKKKHTRGGLRNKESKAAAVAAAVAGASGTAVANGVGPIAAQALAVAGSTGSGSFKNKEKVLVLSTRGITFRYRHLMTDLQTLLPHCKKDNKLDTKSERGVINEVADMKGCSSVIFFEVRKRKDLYIWMAKAPTGPSVKFLVANVHTMAETKLSGNHLKGARPVLSFHAAFDEQPHLQLIKEMLTQIFATPRRHHKSKPFVDHVFAFSVADGRIWFRNYQIVAPQTGRKGEATAGDAAAAAGGSGSARPAGAAASGGAAAAAAAAAALSATGAAASLVEVGPRLCLCPIKIFDGSFGGATLYENPAYVSPNTVRAAVKRAAAGRYKSKVAARAQRKAHVGANPAPQPELAGLFQRGGSDDDEGGGDDGDDQGEGSE